MPYYAQIDLGTGRVVAVTQTAEPVDAGHMVEVDALRSELLGQYHDDGEFSAEPGGG